MDSYVFQLHMIASMVSYETLIAAYPELGNPSSDIQYKLLKIDYEREERTQYFINKMSELTTLLATAFKPLTESISNLSESFKRLDDTPLDVDVYTFDIGTIKWEFPTNINKFFYKRIFDTRTQIKRYSRNRIC